MNLLSPTFGVTCGRVSLAHTHSSAFGCKGLRDKDGKSTFPETNKSGGVMPPYNFCT